METIPLRIVVISPPPDILWAPPQGRSIPPIRRRAKTSIEGINRKLIAAAKRPGLCDSALAGKGLARRMNKPAALAITPSRGSCK